MKLDVHSIFFEAVFMLPSLGERSYPQQPANDSKILLFVLISIHMDWTRLSEDLVVHFNLNSSELDRIE
jgi:hypothetical protein